MDCDSFLACFLPPLPPSLPGEARQLQHQLFLHEEEEEEEEVEVFLSWEEPWEATW